ncbi:hypothetical protein [Pseudoxanthomonas sp. PXM02]|uniref:hypothetical protein n=1 Tax=Pseudoxanthomonas sp. PXM02 TaxID=2769294 RepID=UPI00177DD8DD|nr:hypothetical protein [Pseudoxanthomonas sp. PXM02]MBD9480825.1 hypothetical protein [Pseudoxanthomonas sp. PXM02]
MLRCLTCAWLVLLSFAAWAGDERTDDAPLSDWVEMPIPAETQRADRLVWEYAGNYSPITWHVSRRDGVTIATRESCSSSAAARPSFLPSPGKHDDGILAQRVDDGWLVAFNMGEFGATLYWYSVDGASRYQISSDHIVAFFPWKGQWHAIEGLAHLGSSDGTLVALDNFQGQWRAQAVMTLPGAPCAVAVTDNDDLLITLYEALVRVDAASNLHFLLTPAPWSFFGPTSSAWDERTGALHIGMRQYVARYEPATSTLTMLAPSPSDIHRLTPDEERRIRRQALLTGE